MMENDNREQLRLRLQRRLEDVMNAGEARAVVLLLFEELCGLSTADVLMGKADELPASAIARMEDAVCRVEAGEPVQYVIGKTEFCGMQLEVNPAVLIPRPETEELVRLLEHENDSMKGGTVLDIGTGSGCIALALKRAFPDADVTGWDISADALFVASRNASRNGLDVNFELQNILEAQPQDEAFDIIVSNPPYICLREAEQMEKNVLEHEPHTALFVPDEQPLLFYDAIARYAMQALRQGGGLYFEVNRAYAFDVAQLLEDCGFINIKVHNDQFGNPRIVETRRGTSCN